jgi:hypothetical protein
MMFSTKLRKREFHGYLDCNSAAFLHEREVMDTCRDFKHCQKLSTALGIGAPSVHG